MLGFDPLFYPRHTLFQTTPMTYNEAKTIVAITVTEKATSEAEAGRILADGEAVEKMVLSLIEAVSLADPKATDPQAASDAAEAWVIQFSL